MGAPRQADRRASCVTKAALACAVALTAGGALAAPALAHSSPSSTSSAASSARRSTRQVTTTAPPTTAAKPTTSTTAAPRPPGPGGSRPSAPSAPSATVQTPEELEATALRSNAPVRFGITDDGNGYNPADVEQYISEAGKGIDLYSYDRTFLDGPFESNVATQDSQFGQLEITLESKDYSIKGPDQPDFSLSRIIDGSYDSFLTGFADGMRDYGSTIYLRFDDEMNGNWYPWGAGVNGNQPGQFVAAWRHVHDLFVSQGATNVKWVWAPNVEEPITQPVADFYPGSAYVDVVGMDGYNYGPAEGNTWETPDQIFDQTLSDLQAVAPGKPIWITETGSAEAGGSKAGWFEQLFAWLDGHPQISAVIYEDMDQDQNWRIDTSPSAQAAFKEGIADPRFA